MSLLRDNVFSQVRATFSKVRSAGTSKIFSDSETSDESHDRKHNLHYAIRLAPPPKMALNSLGFVYYIYMYSTFAISNLVRFPLDGKCAFGAINIES